jgi:putative membrane protein
MDPEKKDKDQAAKQNLESSESTDIQRKLEEQIAQDEKSLSSEQLSSALSEERTHMSEHRTKMSEHRTEMSEHRTGLSEHRTDLSEHRTSLSDERTNLSYERTALSYERTLMSWIRTAASLISFGFTIYKFFEEVQKAGQTHKLFTPRRVGMMMIAFGFLGLLFAQIQHVRAYAKLKSRYPQLERSLSSVLGFLILGFGLLLFFATLFRQ